MVAEWREGEKLYEGQEVMYRACDIIGREDEWERLRATLMFGYKGGAVPPQETKGWRIAELETAPLIDTQAQKRWRASGWEWRKQWEKTRNKKLPEKVKGWVLDALNCNLRVCYHHREAKCKACNEEITGKHYLGECSRIREVKQKLREEKIILEEEEVWWISYISAVSCKEIMEVVTRLMKLK